MNKLRVLITTVGGLTSPDIIKAIKNNGRETIFCLGVDPFEFAVGRYFLDAFEIVPDSINEENHFIDRIKSLVN